MKGRLGSKETRELHALLLRRGWRLVRLTGHNHPLYRHDASGAGMTVAGTPSDWRARRAVLTLAARLERG